MLFCRLNAGILTLCERQTKVYSLSFWILSIFCCRIIIKTIKSNKLFLRNQYLVNPIMCSRTSCVLYFAFKFLWSNFKYILLLPWIVDMSEILGFFSYLSKKKKKTLQIPPGEFIYLPPLASQMLFLWRQFSSMDFELHLKLVELLYLVQTLWVAHENISCVPFTFKSLGENISNEHVYPIIARGKFQHRSVRFLDDRGPLPSCCGKYHIYNFGNWTGALEMWVVFFFFF